MNKTQEILDRTHGRTWPERSEDGTCYLCGLRTDNDHEDPLYCIEEMRVSAIKRERDLRDASLEASTRILAVLEHLALRPDAGLVGYTVHNPHTGNKEQLPPQRVAGIFANLRHLYEELGEWSPVRELKEELAMTRDHVKRMASLLEECLPDLPEAQRHRVRLLIGPEKPDRAPPDPGHS